MDQFSQNQTSFIPRKAIGRESAVREKPVSIFIVIATFIFILSIIGAGSAYGYKYLLKQKIDQAIASLESPRIKEALDAQTIDYLTRTDRRLRGSSDLILKHSAATPIFELLESTTLKTVRFNKFEYGGAGDKGLSIKLSGEARSYGSVALQADTLNQSKYVKQAIFSNLNLDDRGNVIFNAEITFDTDLVNYTKNLERSSTPEPEVSI